MKKFRTVADMFLETCLKYDRVAFTYKIDNEWIGVSHQELLSKSINFARSLNKLGFEKGDRIGILSENRVDWVVSDMACALLGCVSVPVFPILTPEQLKFIFDNCGAKGVIVSNKMQLNKILKAKVDLSELKEIFIMDNLETENAHQINELIKEESRINSYHDNFVFIKEISESIEPNDLFTIIYTSGTTGNPKGVMLSHRNICSNLWSSIETGNFNGYSSNLSYLPFCHAYERIGGYYVMFALGSNIHIAEGIEQIASNISDTKPELMSTVPKLMDTVKQKIFSRMSREEDKKRKIFNWAIHIGRNYVINKQKGVWTPFTNIQYKLAKKLVFSKILEKLGGNLKMMVVGGAAMNYETAVFFEMIGVKSVQGYGLTEASPVIAVNKIGNNEIDTVGEPIPEVEVKIADDGEILAKGDNIMLGYWMNEEETEKVIDKNGWLHTGDIGEFTKNGNLKITDRKKDIFVSSGGKNIAPSPIENALMQSRFIDQVVLIGEAKDFCTGLVYPDLEEIKFLSEELNISYDKDDILQNPKILKHLQHDFNEHQKSFSKFEQMRKFRILPEKLTIENGELSPKMSVKRHVVREKYSELIESMYS